ncbi:MAG: AAA family ATPase [Clostridia bacterium]|nr:AAA family ATPase [Clostridia bacterium]
MREWWKREDKVTLIARPRRFGKTLMLSTLKVFFSTKLKDRPDPFEGLDVWNDESMHQEQGSRPVIFLSFASITADTFAG